MKTKQVTVSSTLNRTYHTVKPFASSIVPQAENLDDLQALIRDYGLDHVLLLLNYALVLDKQTELHEASFLHRGAPCNC